MHIFVEHHFISLDTLFENRALASTPYTFRGPLGAVLGSLGLSGGSLGHGPILGCLGFILGRRCAQTHSRRPELPPRLPKTGQYGLQKVPRRPLEVPKMASHSPKTALDGPKMAQDSPMTCPGQLNTGPGLPKTPQDSPGQPKTAPRRAQDSPRQAQTFYFLVLEVDFATAFCFTAFVHDLACDS